MKRVIGYVESLECALNGPDHRPSMVVKLSRDQVEALIKLIEDSVESNGREWFILSITHDNLTRLKVLRGVTPDFEAEAAANYLRGDVLRVNCTQRSCNITFASRVGCTWLLEELRSACARMRRFLEIVVPNRWNKKDLIEFIPDTESEMVDLEEHQRLAEAGAVLAGTVLPEEDFSDWPGAKGG